MKLCSFHEESSIGSTEHDGDLMLLGVTAWSCLQCFDAVDWVSSLETPGACSTDDHQSHHNHSLMWAELGDPGRV